MKLRNYKFRLAGNIRMLAPVLVSGFRVPGFGFEAECYDLSSEPENHRLKGQNKKPPDPLNCK